MGMVWYGMVLHRAWRISGSVDLFSSMGNMNIRYEDEEFDRSFFHTSCYI